MEFGRESNKGQAESGEVRGRPERRSRDALKRLSRSFDGDLDGASLDNNNGDGPKDRSGLRLAVLEESPSVQRAAAIAAKAGVPISLASLSAELEVPWLKVRDSMTLVSDALSKRAKITRVSGSNLWNKA